MKYRIRPGTKVHGDGVGEGIVTAATNDEFTVEWDSHPRGSSSSYEISAYDHGRSWITFPGYVKQKVHIII